MIWSIHCRINRFIPGEITVDWGWSWGTGGVGLGNDKNDESSAWSRFGCGGCRWCLEEIDIFDAITFNATIGMTRSTIVRTCRGRREKQFDQMISSIFIVTFVWSRRRIFHLTRSDDKVDHFQRRSAMLVHDFGEKMRQNQSNVHRDHRRDFEWIDKPKVAHIGRLWREQESFQAFISNRRRRFAEKKKRSEKCS